MPTGGGARELARHSAPFSIALWDESADSLVLGRDAAGLKPLFVTRLPQGGIASATEYKALLAIEAVLAEPDLDALQCLQVTKLTPPGGASLLKGIESAPAAALSRYGRDGVLVATDPMPPLQLAVENLGAEEAARELRDLLHKAVHRLINGRSRVAVALSGGVDSLGVAHLCRACAPDLELGGFTFSQGLDDPEIQVAQAAMRELNGRVFPVQFEGAELAGQLPVAVWHLENPIGRTESALFFHVARRARKEGFELMLSGMGADGLFAGMPRHKVLWLAGVAPWLRAPLLEFFDATQTARQPSGLLASLLSKAYFKGGPPIVPRVVGARPLEAEEHVEPGPEYLNRALIADVLDHNARHLPRIERPLAAYGLEHASPFFDRDVMKFSFRIPSRLKIRRGKGKFVLRRALQPVMSPTFRKVHKGLMRMRQDAGFTAAFQELADAYLNRASVMRRGFFLPEEVERLRLACRGPSYHHEASMRLWTLIVTELWARTFVDGRGAAPIAS